MNLSIKQTLGLTLLAIPIVMPIISVFTNTSEFSQSVLRKKTFQLAYWPGLTYKTEDKKCFIKKQNSRHYQAVASDEYRLAVNKDYHNVFRTYHTISIFIALGFGYRLAFPSEFRDQKVAHVGNSERVSFAGELVARCGDEKHADDPLFYASVKKDKRRTTPNSPK